VKVGGEMHVGLQHVGVDLHFKRRDGRAAFFCEHLSSRRSDARVDLLEQFFVEQRDVVAQGLVAKPFGLVVPRRGRQAEHLAHERVVVGDVFQAIPVGIQAEAHDAQHEDLPEIQAGAARGFFAREDFGFQQGEDLGLECGVHPDPLQAREVGWQFVAALERQANLFDGCDLQVGLELEVMTHGGECLKIGSPKPRQRSKKGQTFAAKDRCLRPRKRAKTMFSYRH